MQAGILMQKVTSTAPADTFREIEYAHSYLTQRDIDPETAKRFGVGYFAGKGSMHGRIVIPIEDERGEQLTYAARSVDGTEPKYLLSSDFRRSATLYNFFRSWRAWETDLEADSVVLVEGFFDCMKVWQAGYLSVAMMGSRL